jgi:hypothetical protein
MSRNKRVAEQLGMSHGTASSRLRKMLLFRQLKKHGENVCVRCKKTIEVIEELSIEHIKPWEGRSTELFWDLDNVAFSHMACNVPHAYNTGGHNKKIAPDGMSWCSAHKRFESVENFFGNVSKWNGLQSHCKFVNAEQRHPKGSGE